MTAPPSPGHLRVLLVGRGSTVELPRWCSATHVPHLEGMEQACAARGFDLCVLPEHTTVPEVARLAQDPDLPAIAVWTTTRSPDREAALLTAGSQGSLNASDADSLACDLLHIASQLATHQRHRARLAHAERALDITLAQRPEAEIDLVTQLPLRASFTAELRRTHHEFPDAAVVCIDLRNFRAINDALGHTAGDELLRLTADRLSAFRPEGSFLARIGSNEFALLLPEPPDDAGLRAVVGALLAQLQAQAHLPGKHVYPTLSVGIARADRGSRRNDLLHDAQAALSESKRHPLDEVVLYTPAHRTGPLSEVSLASELRDAIAANCFALEYQPILCLQTFTIEGFEALLRWNHPQRGTLSPDAFVSFAERSGLIREIGGWVLETAVRDAAQWRLTYPDLANADVNVNLSAYQLPDPTLYDRILHELHLRALPATALHLELTETASMRRIEPYIALLDRLRAAGVGLNLDDFGMGYATLEHLVRLPATALKIDRSFLRAAQPVQRGREVIEAIAQLGRRLGLRVVAEGIETEEQLRYLRAIGLTTGQGYLFSRPVPVASFPSLLHRLHEARRTLASN
jgi:diguanylate cyclase (GGDEF)-like protein